MRSFFSISNMSAGFVGMMVGFTNSIALIFQAARMVGANDAEISSWLLALGLSIAVSCIGLSLRYKTPILVGWSTPGAALLISCLAGASLSEAIGAFVFAGALTAFAGMTGLFERVMAHIPKSLASAMLSGILLQFGIEAFGLLDKQFALVITMFVTYLVGKQFFPRFVIPIILITGLAVAKMQGILSLSGVSGIPSF
jgi:benzoate membrane transport protein